MYSHKNGVITEQRNVYHPGIVSVVSAEAYDLARLKHERLGQFAWLVDPTVYHIYNRKTYTTGSISQDQPHFQQLCC